MDDYEKEVEEIRAVNRPILEAFQAWLEKGRLSEKTVKSHCQNMEFFAEYLLYYEPLYSLDEADSGDVHGFLSEWFPRKALWASPTSTRSHMASFRKFFRFMTESGRIEQTVEDEVRETLKENKEAFLDAVGFDDTDDDWW